MKQKIVQISKGGNYLLGPSGGGSYLSSQCEPSQIQEDLGNGWLVKAVWEDEYYIVLLMELRR